MKTKLFSILAVLFCAAVFTGCDKKDAEDDQVQEITLNKSFDLAINSERTVVAKITPETASDKSIKWTSSDDLIAAVDGKGVVMGVALGKVTITATAVNGVKGTCEVTVVEHQIFLEALQFNEDTIVIDMAQTKTYDFSKDIQLLPENANANTTIAWSVNLYSGSVDIDKSTGIATMITSTGGMYAEIVAVAGSITDTCRVEIIDLSTPSIGDFYYSDHTFSTKLNTAKTCIGVVFCPKMTPTQGEILEKSLVVGFDITKDLVWSPNATKTNANDRFYGWRNVEKLKAIDNTLANYPAAKWCNDKQGDWYLPAEEEWSQLFSERVKVNAAFQTLIDAGVKGIVKIGGTEGEAKDALSYWTSTEGYNPKDESHFEKEAMFFRLPMFGAWYTDKTKTDGGDLKVICVRAIMAF